MLGFMEDSARLLSEGFGIIATGSPETHLRLGNPEADEPAARIFVEMSRTVWERLLENALKWTSTFWR